jgi:ribonuclease VapC
MIFVDASVIVAMLAPEDDGPAFAARIEGGEGVLVSPVVIWEAVIALARIRRSPIEVAERSVSAFLEDVAAETIPIDAAIGTEAVDAFARYGKGRHPAALNMGDCFAYACARSRNIPLLAKGDDFTNTDIERA